MTTVSGEALEPVAEALVSENVFEVDFTNRTILSPAEELILAAQKAGEGSARFTVTLMLSKIVRVTYSSLNC